MREGTRTVLSMQNNYQGPPEDFALVVPVPVVLKKDQVKTLPRDVFDKVDAWARRAWSSTGSRTPATSRRRDDRRRDGHGEPGAAGDERRRPAAPARDYGVTIEAQFVGRRVRHRHPERDRVDRARPVAARQPLRDPGRRRARCSGPTSRPATKFFVAKVDPKKVTFKDGMATLSPAALLLRQPTSSPCRSGSAWPTPSGTQDLIVNILAPQPRYEVANYPNVTIPTNLDVKDAVRDAVRRVLRGAVRPHARANPGAVVTEYAWDAGSCDPCPGPTLEPGRHRDPRRRRPRGGN